MSPNYEIRETKKNDIEEITSLINLVFEIDLSCKYVDWLLTDPQCFNGYNSIVAIKNGNIIGHCGFVHANYSDGRNQLKGNHAISWCVHPDYIGRIGIKIFRIVSLKNDLSIVYEGTQAAKRIYPHVGFKVYGPIWFYQTTISSSFFYNKYSLSDIKKMIISLWNYFNYKSRKKMKNKKIEIIPFSHKIDMDIKYIKDWLSNSPDQETLNWFKKCESLESYIFSVKHGNTNYGILYLYKSRNRNGADGRIHHLPNMGNDLRLWISLIEKIENYFKLLGCVNISVCCTHPIFLKALDVLRYRMIEKNNIWIFDPKNKIKNKKIHLTYIEGDHGFRNL